MDEGIVPEDKNFSLKSKSKRIAQLGYNLYNLY